MPNRLIEPLSPNTKIQKPRLVATINGAIDEINKIHELYSHFFLATDEKPSLAQKIEDELKRIKDEYAGLFGSAGGNASKIEQLDTKIKEIETYHKQLIADDDSIKADIKDSQDKITEFYVTLFQTYETKGDGGQKAKLEAAFKSIISFDEDLNKAGVGYRAKIEKAKDEILTTYDALFAKDKKTNNQSKVDLLNEHVTEASKFHDKLQNEIAPYLQSKQKEMDDVALDISVKQAEVDSLLSKTTISALSQGYREAMQIYGDPVYMTPPKNWGGRVSCTVKNFTKAIKHFIKFIGSYVLFIGPLVIIGLVFATNWAQSIFNFDGNGNVQFSGSEYIFYKLTIALPLLWVSWYGQRSISHRKRLFEEYNHKLRVVQMYLQFITKNETYVLSKEARKQLEEALLRSVERNPSEVYGKDETFVDKVLEVFASGKRNESPASAQAATIE